MASIRMSHKVLSMSTVPQATRVKLCGSQEQAKIHECEKRAYKPEWVTEV